jgi:Fic family protein
MKTFQQFASKLESVPMAAAWYLSDLGEARGKQELFTKQSPQKLKVLREHALIESAVSSNRIEGVTIDPGRIKAVMFGKSRLRDRSEEEVRGYRDALKWIHEESSKIPVSEKTILKLHELTRGQIWDAGKYNLKQAYLEFETRVGELKSPRGEKTELVQSAIARFEEKFTLNELEQNCPGVSRDMIRRILRNLQRIGRIECVGRGPGALWRKEGNNLKRG